MASTTAPTSGRSPTSPSTALARALDFAPKVLDDAGGAVPVLDPDGHEVVGWLTHKAALIALRSAVAPSEAGRGARSA